MTSSDSLVTVLLGFAAMLLGIAVAVQVFQEMWKYVTSSRHITYHSVLRDFLGPYLSRQLDRPGVLRDLEVRGPFQGLWWRPSGKLLPMNEDELVAALERTTSEWFQRTYAAIRLEAKLQVGGPAKPSAAWAAFRRELNSTGTGASEAHAKDIRSFLSAWEDRGDTLDAAGLLTVFHHQFLPQARKVEDHFDQLMRNFDFHYRRRNLRQTLVIAFLLAVLLDLPAGELYRRAAALSPEAAVGLAEAATRRYEAENRAVAPETTDSLKGAPRADSALALFRERADSALAIATGRPDPIGTLEWPPTAWTTFRRGAGAGTGYLLQCLMTALLVSFGAPFLNDLTKILLRSSKPNGERAHATSDVPETRVITTPAASAARSDHV